MRLPGRVVFGEFDPLLRRIVLYDAAARSDGALVRAFLHEAAHALRPELVEAVVIEIAERLHAGLTASDRHSYASELRRRQRRASALQPIAALEPATGCVTGVSYP